jgi:hypothetical protein
MDNKKLGFLDDGQSIALAITQLHNYFANACSSSQVKHGQLMSQIRSSQSENSTTYQEELEQLSEEITLFAALRDSLSIADNLLHSKTIIKTLGENSEVFQIHLEDEAEQEKERRTARRKVPTE